MCRKMNWRDIDIVNEEERTAYLRVCACARACSLTIHNLKGAQTLNKTALLRQIALISSSISPRNPHQVCRSPSLYTVTLLRDRCACACMRVYTTYIDGGHTRAVWHAVGASRVSEFNESEAEREENEAGVSVEYSRLILPSPKERMRRTGEG